MRPPTEPPYALLFDHLTCNACPADSLRPAMRSPCQDCQEIWRQLFFMRFTSAFGKFRSWKTIYIQVRS